jgi:hypothetical protein
MTTFKEKVATFERGLTRLRLYLWALGGVATAVYYFQSLPLPLVILIGLAAFAVTLAVVAIFSRFYDRWHHPALQDQSLWPILSVSLAAFLVSSGAIWYYISVYQVQELFAEKLPGFSFISVIELQDKNPGERQYVFDQSSPGGGRVAFYLSRSEHFTFSVTDIHGEAYSLEVPLGRNGIPVGKFIYLLCEIGVASDRSYIRIMLDDRVLSYRILYFPIDLGGTKWTGSLGADLNGRNNAAFALGEAGIFDRTLSKEEFARLSLNAKNFYKLSY